MAKITFSQSNNAGDIPIYNYTLEQLKDDKFTDVYEMFANTDDKVFVCFISFSEIEDCPYQYEHPEFLITQDKISAEMYFNNFVTDMTEESFNFNFFCFENYEEAFKYCTDLKEGL